MAQFPADVVSVSTSSFRVQMQSFSGQHDMWLTVFRPADGNETRTLPATFHDVVEAEIFTNKMRDEHPDAVYRVVRDVTITEVVHI